MQRNDLFPANSASRTSLQSVGSSFLGGHDAPDRQRSSPEPSSSRNNSLGDGQSYMPTGIKAEDGEEAVKKARKSSSGVLSNLTSKWTLQKPLTDRLRSMSQGQASHSQ
jgi:hypothetical protein